MTEPTRPAKPPLGLRQLAYLVTVMVATSIFSLPLLAVAVLTGFRARRFYSEVMVRRFCQLLLYMARIRVTQHGRDSVPPGPVFYMPNHPSTQDIFILMALGLPNTRFFMGRRVVVPFLPLGLIAWIMGVLFTPDHDDTPARILCFQHLTFGQVVLEQQVPQVAAFVGEAHVAGQQDPEIRLRRAASRSLAKGVVELIEGAAVQVDDEVVQIDKDVVERAHGVADPRCDPPGRQASQTFRFGNFPGRAQGQLVELLAAVVVATGHDLSSISGVWSQAGSRTQ